MKITLSICVVLLVVFAFAVPVYCQSDSLVDGMKTIDGNVVSVNVQDSSVVVKAYEAMTFSVSSKANIINADGFDIRLSDVKTGSYVTIDYYDDQSGKHVLTGMEVEYKN